MSKQTPPSKKEGGPFVMAVDLQSMCVVDCYVYMYVGI